MNPAQSPLPPVRRVVTGNRNDGQSVIVLDDEPAATEVGAGEGARVIFEVWATAGRGQRPPTPHAPTSSTLGPDATEIRVVDMPPGARREMHRTDTVDYGIVISGELHLILEGAERLLRCGDIVVQNGTLHSWQNRSNSVARLVFVNMSGQVTDDTRCPAIASGK
jgi:quercetin dioxygenase-like cupin family protein